ncbi:molecular chaperone TorD [Halomonas icarae]|uniref:Molecular chaperone TorD n=1 Tax=Halomonas icarae TaxID=2691040 RepID=A0A7X4W188_9GAMM|nr:molecular chaperone TorD [Halomonas icarae]MDR5902479.1 molecular chaperone TorD [Halomonas icarae]NAW14137.1 molecular chaperone TorD [Halomonas icarae]
MRESASPLAAARPEMGERQPVDWESESLLCRWLATVLGTELDDASLERYRNGEAAPFFDYLRDAHGMTHEVARLDEALSRLVMLRAPRLELAADFTELFLVDARSGAPPYASLYAGGEGGFHGEAAERMEARLSEAGYAVRREVAEPADHLAVMLDYLATRLQMLAEAEGPAREEMRQDVGAFLKHELCSWLPLLVSRSAAVKTVSDFYPALLALADAYCHRLSHSPP